MKILFVSRGNSSGKATPNILNQGESLKRSGVDVDFYVICGKGSLSYLKSIIPLRRKLKAGNYDVIHAHYSFSAFVATLASSRRIIVSLMGSDVKTSKVSLHLTRLVFSPFWKKCIVKSEDMKKTLGIKGVHVIPNGVNMETFGPLNMDESRKKINWNSEKRHILLAGDPSVPEKNFPLAKQAFELIRDPSVELHWLEDVSHTMMPLLYNAADVVLLSSNSEGSPNAIKEALSCNRPIVSTDVGDVKAVLDGVEGCYIASFDPEDVAEKLKAALDYNKPVKGRERLVEIKYDERSVAGRLIELYSE